MACNGVIELISGTLTFASCIDYGMSIMILPITIMIYDLIPPHIATNYTWFTNPGIRRIIKMLLFAFIAVGIMFVIQYVVMWPIADVQNGIEYAALRVGEAANSVKFLP